MSRLALFHAAEAADRDWMREVVQTFGTRDAGSARCHGHATGEAGSRLRELYDRYSTARDAYRAHRH